MNPDTIAKLQASTPVDAISFKPQGKPFASKHGPGYVCKAVPYVDARFVMQRLDDAVGPGNWATDVKNVGGLVAVGIGILVVVDGTPLWVWKWDTGMDGNPFRTGGDGDKKGDKRDEVAYKGLISNGLKRAANQWGIGRDTYNLGIKWMPCEVYPDNPEKFKAWLPVATTKAASATSATKANGVAKKDPKASQSEEDWKQDAVGKIIKVLVERIGMQETAARAWLASELATTDGSVETYRAIYSKALKEV